MQEFSSPAMSSSSEEVNTTNPISWSFLICIGHTSHPHYLSSIHIGLCTQGGIINVQPFSTITNITNLLEPLNVHENSSLLGMTLSDLTLCICTLI